MCDFIKRSILILSVIFTVGNSNVFSQDTVKIMTYNLLNYNGSVVKDQSFRKIIGYSKPDVIVVEEIISQSAVNSFLTNVLNYYTPGLYSAGTFFNGFDTDNGVFYKTSGFTFLFNYAIPTTLRTINLFGLTHNTSGVTIQLFAVHLKAGNSVSDQQQRLSEVNVLRNFTNTFPDNTEFVVLGDFNIYSSVEACYQRLLQTEVGSQGHFIDPYNLSGTWNQSAYASYHTQSTRTRSLNDSGATGGLDDRFDMILNSKAVTEEGRIKFIPGSLKPLGNDGNHYNDSINQRPNTAVPDSVADALYLGADHLPVTALYKFEEIPISVSNITNSIPAVFKLYQNYPNPFNPGTKVNYELGIKNYEFISLKIYDALGIEVADLVNQIQNAGRYEVDFDGSELSSGIYFYSLFTNGKLVDSKRMILIK